MQRLFLILFISYTFVSCSSGDKPSTLTYTGPTPTVAPVAITPPPVAAAAAPTLSADKLVYMIQNHSGLCANIPGGNNQPGHVINQELCSGGATNQLWTLNSLGVGKFQIKKYNGTLCITIKDEMVVQDSCTPSVGNTFSLVHDADTALVRIKDFSDPPKYIEIADTEDQIEHENIEMKHKFPLTYSVVIDPDKPNKPGQQWYVIYDLIESLNLAKNTTTPPTTK